jgi:KDO2-lipid IV(A) lauroyltransferase
VATYRVYNRISLLFINIFTLLVPRWLFPPCAALTGWFLYPFMVLQRRGIRENLRVVTGRRNVELLVLSAFYKYSRYWCDVMLMSRLRGKGLERMIRRVDGSTMLEAPLAAGTGAIIVTPHLGNWELGGLLLAEMGFRINVLTYREPDEKVNEERETIRKERGINTIYVDRDSTSPLAIIEAVNALRRNEVVALLGDRDGSSNTIDVEFFGRQTPMPAGAAYLALATGAPVIPVFLPLVSGRYATIVAEPIHLTGSRGKNSAAVRSGMEQLARVFEKQIRLYPDQWYNFFPYWDQTISDATAHLPRNNS